MSTKKVAPSKRYAYGTTVTPAKSRAEIETTIARFGATGFGFATQGRRAMIFFEAHGRRIRFNVPEPKEPGFGAKREAANAAEERRLWRSLAMAIKSKLDMIESGITTFEIEFLPYTMLDDGRTFGEAAEDPAFVGRLSSSALPPMLTGDR